MQRLLALPLFAALFALAVGGTCNERAQPSDGGPDDGAAASETAGSPRSGSAGNEDPAAIAVATAEELPEGFVFELRDGAPERGPAPTPPTPATRLDDKAAQTVLDRLPPIDMGSDDVVPFALREGSKPPPRTGETIAAPFPPPPSADLPPSVETGPLSVLRYQPEGPVPLAPRITVTFSHPMVPLTSHDTLAKMDVPAKLTPDIDGNWRWVGTKTLFFDPVGRAPMATDYTVEVPAGVKDATGRPLAEGASWTFHTPPPSVIGSSPSGNSVALEPTLWATFDQRVDPKALLAAVKVSAGGRPTGVRALTPEETKSLPKSLSDNKDLAGRWVAFRLKEKLAPATHVIVTFPKGTPSAEGPRTTDKDQTHSFRTYGPMKLERAQCGWNDRCYPGTPFSLSFTNPVDEDTFTEDMVTVEPAPANLRVVANGGSISLYAMTKGKTKYTVKVSNKIKDIYGQNLDKASEHTWNVGPSSPRLFANMKTMQVLDPMAKKLRLPVHVLNMPEVDVELYRVTPSDYGDYLKWHNSRMDNDKPKAPPGKKVFDKRVKTGAPAEELTEFGVDLSPALTGKFGQMIAVVRPVGVKDRWERDSMTVVTWLQVTQLGLDAFVDGESLVAWVTDLQNGKAAEGVECTFVSAESTTTNATTDARGIATFGLPGRALRQTLVARRGEDVAFIADSDYAWARQGNWVKRIARDTVRWYVVDDRSLYRPDETVSVKGMLRLFEGGKKGDVAGLPAGSLTRVEYTVTDSRNNDIGKGSAKISPNGSFHFQFKTPKTPNLGRATIHIKADVDGFSGTGIYHSFQIQEFRRPEFEVSASASEGPHVVGASATASLTASYFAGGPLANTAVTWNVRSGPGHFSPPNHNDYIFGSWTPWWGSFRGFRPDNSSAYQTLQATTDGSGTHHLALDFKSVSPPRAMSVSAEGTVVDVNRQSWSTTTTLLVHPALAYAGLKTERYFVKADEPIELEVVAVDIDGKRLVGTEVDVRVVRLEWKKVKSEWKEVELDPEDCKVISKDEPEKCRFMPKAGGRHRITAKLRDAAGRRNETSMSMWVPGGKQPEKRELEMETVDIIPSQRKFDVGDTAEFLVQSPFSPAEGMYLIRRGGIVSEHAFRIDKDTATIKLPIEEWMIPGVTLSVHLNGAAPRAGAIAGGDVPLRPAFASGTISIGVPPALRTLAVEAVPAASRVEPGGETSVEVTVKDHAGKPVSKAEVTLIIVDESVLALSGYALSNPLALFYAARPDPTRAIQSRSRILLAAMAELIAEAVPTEELNDMLAGDSDGFSKGAGGMGFAGSGRGGGGAGAGIMPAPKMARAMERSRDEAPAEAEPAASNGPIAVRSNFDPLALFAPDATTNADGKVTVKVKLPDNLTRYRVMAIATSGAKHFGTGESSITARLPLMIRMSAPRFLNFGDRFEMPVVIQNQTDKPLDVKIALRSTNALVTDGAGRAVSVPANDRVEVRFPMAADKPGTARMQAGVVSRGWADAAEVKLPVWTPATTEAFATYGEIDKGATLQPVQLPEDVVAQFGGLEVQTSSTQLQALTEAVIYLSNYPYECAEQLSSRILSIAALKDVLGAFKADGLPSTEALVAKVDTDIKRLRGMQGNDGGFAFWRRDQESWPFLTVHVTHALIRAQEKGFEVPRDMLNRAQRYLKQIRSKMNRPYYTEDVKRSIESYALYVRNRMKDNDAARARAIIKEGGGLDKVPMDVVGWLYPVVAKTAGFEADVAAIRKHIMNRVTETAGAANFVSSFGDGAWLMLYSNRRIDGLLLEGLIDDQPKSDLIPKVVRGLLAHKTKGHWGSTQENAWVLLGLDRYFNVFENVTPDFLARAWLGNKFAGEHRFKGRTTERYDIQIRMQQLVDLGGKGDLVIAKEGAGRLYYRLGMRYAPKSLDLKAANHGFHVERTYASVDHPDDVKRDADGHWVVKAGARVKVKLTMHTDSRRYHVALVDPMPAGFEALNPELKGAQAAPPPKADDDDEARSRGRRYWWWGPWYEHENLRDERAEAFTSLLWEGVYTYVYYARATTIGDFIVPPAKAEEMYAPETFGRSASEKLSVR